jgi:TPP-dependent pyruvate/acetoin dehydrogenase alpha subunit
MYRIEKQKNVTYTVEQLRKFESDVAEIFQQGKIRGPVHLSYGNEDYLIKLFEHVNPNDWVFSTWRNHYHALLHGVPEEYLRKRILEGHSISFQSPDNNFFTSAIVNGIIPIAVGTALGLKWNQSRQMVWCFVGDMAAESGVFYEAVKYSIRNALPIHFVVEDNTLSTNTPTQESWGTIAEIGFCSEIENYLKSNPSISDYISYFKYKREKYPHQGTGIWVNF